jgi:hypothetical protein
MPRSCLGTIADKARLARTTITAPMYLEHFGLSEPPFTITPHTEFSSPAQTAARRWKR